MKFIKPKFWDLKKPNFISFLLYPFTLLVLLNNIFLNLRPKKKYKEIKTICFGNIYVGGTGKTPATIKLYETLKDLKFNVATAKKFYHRQKDEQTILRNNSKLLTLDNREKIIKEAIKKKFELIIFDDGLQDSKIDYDIKFVCFDIKKWIGNGCLIPSGPLREKIKSIKKYDAILLKSIDENLECSEIYSMINKINPNIRVFKSKIKIKNLDKFDLNKKYLIFSGIGNNYNFREILLKNRFNIVEEINYPDHFNYSKNDIYKILEIAKNKDAKILTTEKDYVKIQNENKDNINFIKIDLEFLDQKEFIMFIKSKLNEKN